MKTKKAVELKVKNKRFTIAWLDDNTIFFQTKTLQDWEKRIITHSGGIYSVESFIFLAELFDFMYNDVDFRKQNNNVFGANKKLNATAKVFDFINNIKQ